MKKTSTRIVSLILALCVLLGLLPSGAIIGRASASGLQMDDLSVMSVEQESLLQPDTASDEQIVSLPEAETRAASPSVLFHFDGKTGNTLLDSLSAWDTGSTTMYSKSSFTGGDLDLNTAGSKLVGSFNKLTRVSDNVIVAPQLRTKPFAELDSSFSYTINSGDIIEVCMRVDTTAGAVHDLQIHLAADGNFIGQYVGEVGHTWDTGSNFAYYRATVNSGCFSKKLTQLQLALVPSSDADKAKLAGYWDIDYVFIGQLKDAPSQHLVTFYDYNGTTILKQEYVENGQAATAPATPVRPVDASKHYTFSKWVTAKGGTTAASFSKVTKDMNIYASYTEHAITFPTYDETRHQIKCATCNKTWWEAHAFNSSGKCTLCGASKNSTPYLLIDFDNRDKLNRLEGWSDTFSLGRIQNLSVKDSLYTGSFKAANPFIRTIDGLINYTIKEGDWIDIRMKVDNTDTNGEVFESIMVVGWIDGKDVAIRSFGSATLMDTNSAYKYYRVSIPEKASNNTVQLWNKKLTQLQISFLSENGTMIKGNFGVDYIYIGQPNLAPSQHKVTFYDYNGTTVLDTQYVTEGEAANAPKTPTRDSDTTYHYTFSKWVTAKGGSTTATLTNIKADKNVYASYTAEKHDYNHIGRGVTVAVCKHCFWQESHTLSYTNNGINHTVKCVTECGSYTENHSYRNNACICGATISDNYLFFGFTNSGEDQNRYNSDVYGGVQFDKSADNWSGVTTGGTKAIDTSGEGTLTITPAKAGDYSVWAQTGVNGQNISPLNYVPEAGDVYQIRVKFENITARSGYTPILRLYFADQKGRNIDTTNDLMWMELDPKGVESGEYQVYTVSITPAMAAKAKFYAIRPYFGHLNTSKAGAKVVIDYVYLGSREDLVEVTKYDVSGNPGIPENVYDGLSDINNPKDDVSIHKTAAPVGNFNETGVAKVELSAQGASEKKGIDLLFVLDVSNSMAWSVENGGGYYDTDRLPSDGQNTKMEDAVSMMDEFAHQLLDGNTNVDSDNTFSLVTFAGYDRQNNVDTGTQYIDSVTTPFIAQKEKELVCSALNLTSTFGVATSDTTAKYMLTLGTIQDGAVKAVSGINRGGTNYDYGFSEAIKAVDSIKKAVKGSVSAYNASERQLVLVFLADGMPTTFNDEACFTACGEGYNTQGVQKVVTGDYIYGTKTYIPYAGTRESALSNTTYLEGYRWMNHLMGGENGNGVRNTYATTLYSKVDRFEVVGFDMAHGLYSNHVPEHASLSQGEVDKIMEESLAKVPLVLSSLVQNVVLNPKDAEDASALKTFRKDLINKLQYAGTHVKVTDVIGGKYNLQTAAKSGTGSIKVALSPKPSIEIKKNGTLIERVTFSDDGTSAYSSKLGSSNNIMSADGKTIRALYFTYNMDSNGNETFKWNVGIMDESKYTLSYYAYLEGSLEGKRAKGNYPTNESAVIEYADTDGKHATKTYTKPEMPWNQAATTVEYYLVNEYGEPVDQNGNIVSFENRVIISTGSSMGYNLNSSKTVAGEDYVPDGYTMYNPDASYSATSYSAGSGNMSITDDQGSTTYRVDNGGNDYTNTKVAFAVVVSNFKLVPDTIVLDYGKAIIKDVTANEVRKNNTYTAVGFVAPNSTMDLAQAYEDVGSASYYGENGVFSLSNGVVTYTPARFMSSADDVFVVIKITDHHNAVTYRYQQFTVLPAESVLYESDFSSEEFANTSLFFGFDNTTADQSRYNSVTYGGRNYDRESNPFWYTDFASGRKDFSINNSKGVLTMDLSKVNTAQTGMWIGSAATYGTTTGRENSLNYKVKPSDVMLIRFRLTNAVAVSGRTPTIYWRNYHFDESGATVRSNASNSFTITNGKYITVTVNATSEQLKAAYLGGFAIQFQNVTVKDTSQAASIEIDYIYIGSEPNAEDLFFDFTNDSVAKDRYNSPAYGYHNFDAGSWVTYNNGSGNGNFSYNNASGILRLPVTDSLASNLYGPTVKTSSVKGNTGTINTALGYIPKNAEVMQVRFVLKNSAFDPGNTTDLKPVLQLQYVTETNGQLTAVQYASKEYEFANNKYINVTFELPDTLKNADRLCYFALRFKHIKQSGTSAGTVEIHHIYIGSESNVPGKINPANKLYFDFGNTFEDQNRYISNPAYNGYNFDLSSSWCASSGTKTDDKGTADASDDVVGYDTAKGINHAEGTISFRYSMQHVSNDIAYNYFQIRNQPQFSYIPAAGEYYQIRFKVTNVGETAGDTFNFLLFGQSVDSQSRQITGTRTVSTTDAEDRYITLTGPMNSGWASGTEFKHIYIRFNKLPLGSVAVVDYLYIGSKEDLPVPESAFSSLFFGFGNGDADRFRYERVPMYGEKNFDIANWCKADRLTDLSYIPSTGTLSTEFKGKEDSTNFWIQSSTKHDKDFALDFHPTDEMTLQVRFKLNGFKKSGNADARLYLSFYTDSTKKTMNGVAVSNGDAVTRGSAYWTIPEEDLSSGKFITANIDLLDSFFDANQISAIRLTVQNVAKESNDINGTFALDYVYIGLPGGVVDYVPGQNSNIAEQVKTINSDWSQWKTDSQNDNKQDDGTVGYVHDAANANSLYFGFNDTKADWMRYGTATYCNTNFDQATSPYWYTDSSATTKDFEIDNSSGVFRFHYNKNGSWIGNSTQYGVKGARATALNYKPKAGDVVQIRFKLNNCTLTAGKTASLQFSNYSPDESARYMGGIGFTFVTNSYIVVTKRLSDAMVSAARIGAFAIQFNNIEPAADGTSTIDIDYIYVGAEAGAPDKHIYGYDFSYANDKGFSHGTALHANSQGVTATTTEFTFTGTGFDIISATGSMQGTFRTKVYNAKTGELVKTWSVTNKSDTDLDLYQVPSLSIDDLPFGTYRVEIGVLEAYNNPAYPGLTRGGEFILDAIRIYNPIDTTKGSASTGDSLTAYNAYVTDIEANPTITEVRETLVQGVEAGEGFESGFGFVDYYNGTGVNSTSWDEYKNISPKTEVYLSKGQAVTFQIHTSAIPVGFHIAAKSADGRAVCMTAVISNNAEMTGSTNTIERTIATCSPMYYDLFSGMSASNLPGTVFAGNKAFVVVTNTGDGILSITDVKALFANPKQTASYKPTAQALSFARFALMRVFNPAPQIKNGIVEEDGCFMYYVDGNIQHSAGLVIVDGNYYYIRSGGQAAIGKYWVTNTNGLMEQGFYEFDSEGKMILPEAADGIVEVDGELFYYIKGKLACGAGLIELDGKYYYIRSSGQVAVGRYWVTKTNGLMPEGFYTFQDDGTMRLRNGIVYENGGLFYYVNDELQLGAGLIMLNGAYYYVRSNGQAAIGIYWVTNTNGLLPEGMYTFGEDGKMIQKNGIVDIEGALYYYVNDQLQLGAGLIELNGSYYYIRSNGQAAIGRYWVTNCNGLLDEGYYTFGEDGKMIQD